MKIVIVGGVAGGASAAARARRVDAEAEIVMLEKGQHVSFANCGLPYHLGGEIENRDDLLVASPELFWNRFRIDVRTGHDVTSIDRQRRVVSGHKAEGDQFSFEYDRLILAVGSQPVRPPFYQHNLKNVFHLWTLDDLDHILEYMRRQGCRQATVVGAGFIGLEVVEQLVRAEIAVTLLELGEQVLSPLDPELARLIEEQLREHQVELLLGEQVEQLLSDQQRATAVKLANGDSLSTDLVIVGAGVRPRTELAQQCGIELGACGSIAVNEFRQTSDPNIYAVGDCSEYQHAMLDRPVRMPLAGPANRSGRIAGGHAAGNESLSMGPVLGTAVVRVFELGAAITGLNEKMCRAEGIEYRTATISAPHHAGYFPGAQSLTLKVLYNPEDRKVLGAQAIGAAGIDKRIDVIATTIHFGGTIDDLAELDLAYAPPYGAAKDPIHMAAFVAQNDLDAHPGLLHYDAALDGWQVVDVRTSRELEQLPLAGAVHIPIDDLHERWDELDPHRPTVTVCHSGKRAHVAACFLQGKGFEQVKNLSGGMSLRRHFR